MEDKEIMKHTQGELPTGHANEVKSDNSDWIKMLKQRPGRLSEEVLKMDRPQRPVKMKKCDTYIKTDTL